MKQVEEKEWERQQVYIAKLEKAVLDLDRGCDCDHDYRCSRCDKILYAKDLVEIEKIKRKEAKK